MQIYKQNVKKYSIELSVSEINSLLQSQTYCINQTKKHIEKKQQFAEFGDIVNITNLENFNQRLRKVIY